MNNIPEGFYLINNYCKPSKYVEDLFNKINEINSLRHKFNSVEFELEENKNKLKLIGWKRIPTLEELAKTNFYNVEPIYYGTMILPNYDDNGSINYYSANKIYKAQIYNDGTGIAYVNDWKFCYKNEKIKAASKEQCMVIKFYKFGCNHEFYFSKDNVKDGFGQLGKCEKYYKCNKCHYGYVVDSSD